MNIIRMRPGERYSASNLKPKIYFQSFDSDTTEILANLDGLVDSFQIKKTYHDVSGSFQLKLIHTVNNKVLFNTPFSIGNYLKKLQLNDIITISYGIPIMTGLIDTIREFEQYGNDGIEKGFIVAGRDFGSVLVDDQQGVVFSALLKGIDNIDSLKAELGEDHPIFKVVSVQRSPEGGTFFGSAPPIAIDFVMENLTALRIPIRYRGNEFDAINFIRIFTEYDENDIIGLYENNVFEGSIYNFIFQLLDSDFYELLMETDIRPFSTVKPAGHPVMRIRPKQFNRRNDNFLSDTEWNWENIKNFTDGYDYHTIADDVILSEDSGISKTDVYSVYTTQLSREILFNNQIYQSGMNLPVIDAHAMKNFGFRPLGTTSGMVDISGGKEGFDFNKLFRKRDKQFVFNRFNQHYLDGSNTIIGDPYIRVGDRIHFPNKYSYIGKYRGIEAFVSGISWDYDVNRIGSPKFVTRLEWIKGHNEQEYNEYCEETKDKIFKINALTEV